MPHNVSELLILLNRAHLTAPEKERARQLALTIDWTAFFERTERNSAQVLTAQRLLDLNLGEGPQRESLLRTAEDLRRKSQRRTQQAQIFLQSAHEEGLEVILLKGALLGATIYADLSYKKMNDIDVLVRPRDAEKTAALLEALGYVSAGKLLESGEFSDKSHHFPPFLSADQSCLVGVHWGLCSPFARWKPDHERIWRNRQPLSFGSAPAFRMSWEESLLHLCTHLPFFKIGVRELSDVYNLILFCQPAIDWAVFETLVSEWRAEDAAYRVLSLASSLTPLKIPPEALARWKAKALSFTRHDTERRVLLGPDLIATRSVQIGKIEKAFAFFRLSQNNDERLYAWAKTWSLCFWPNAKELPPLLGRLDSPRGADRVWGRLRVGFLCWNAMARDYGQTALTLITLLNIVIIIKDTLLRPFRRTGPPLRQNPVFKVLESLE